MSLKWPKSLRQVTQLKRRNQILFGLHHLPFVILYAIALKWCFDTAGEPLATALAAQAAKEAQLALNGTLASSESEPTPTEDVGVVDESSESDASEKPRETPLPNELLPSFWAVLFLIVVVLAHSLLWFAQRWSVKFRAFVHYSRVNSGAPLQRGSVLLVEPHEHQGRAEIVSVEQASDGTLFFVFQRQRFEVDGNDIGELSCPVNLPLQHYTSARGIGALDVAPLEERFGKNSVAVPDPTFLDIFINQILGPVPVFQIFCTTLWLLDEYWNYAIFHFVMICMLEASTSFSRLKSVSSLKGMRSTTSRVYVLRDDQWVKRDASELLPGDVFSVPDRGGREEGGADEAGGDVAVPCDAIILRGSAVVNEASLTGESVPQMKEAVKSSGVAAQQRLDMNGEHRAHVLFSGTTVMQIGGAAGDNNDNNNNNTTDADADDVLQAPDGGCVCCCLRTGFASSQGTLVRMIEYSSESVKASTGESLALLLLLLLFAMIASGYVLWTGLQSGKRTQYELVLRCVLILTSVVPPELPMQMAVSVNTAILALWRSHIFCTEPFRVPYAGKLTDALFDKTGTLTTDQLQVVGVASCGADSDLEVSEAPSSSLSAWQQATEAAPLAHTNKARVRARVVLAACHSLVSVADALVGDPTEMAAMRATGWQYDAKTHTARPPSPNTDQSATKKVKSSLEAEASSTASSSSSSSSSSTSTSSSSDTATKASTETCNDAKAVTSVRALHNYTFASRLQRMSVVVEVALPGINAAGSGAGRRKELWVLAKGSPEKLGRLCVNLPPAYESTYRSMTENGHRVLALAYRRLDDDETKAARKTALPREQVERDLLFVGFVAMSCLVRKDSAHAVAMLQGGALHVAMVTGDATLTALYVARQVGIADANRPALLLTCVSDNDANDTAINNDDNSNNSTKPKEIKCPTWEPALRTQSSLPSAEERKYSAAQLESLSKRVELVVSGPAMRAALASDSGTPKVMQHVRVFARMTPADKEQLLRWRRADGAYTLMCGDGANDVGALKQAHVGLALLSGFGTANTVTEGEKPLHEQSDEERRESAKAVQTRAKERAAAIKADRALLSADLQRLQQQYYQEELTRLEAAGESWATVKAVTAAGKRMMAESRKRHAEIMRKHGAGTGAGGAGGALAAQAAMMAADMGGADDGPAAGMPTVKLGDASVAAPFTSKLPSIRSAVDIVRQGRCTLVSSVQNQQIMTLNCLITAYSLSAMAIDGVRFGETQMIATGLLFSVAGIAFTYARPVQELAAVHPLGSIFHPAVALSTVGQLAIHLGTMVLAVRMARAATTGEESVTSPYEPEWLKMVLAASASPASKKFKPALLNTVVFLVETAQQVAVMAVNYKGRPFMLAATENSAMLWSLLLCGIGLFAAATERWPSLNGALRLVGLPDDAFRVQLLVLLTVSIFGSLLWDRLVVAVYAPRLMLIGYRDAYRALPTFAQLARKLLVLFYWLFAVTMWGLTDNILIMGLFWYLWAKNKFVRKHLRQLEDD